MDEGEEGALIPVLVLGDASVGKTEFIRSYGRGRGSRDDEPIEMGKDGDHDCLHKNVFLQDQPLHLVIYDTPGVQRLGSSDLSLLCKHAQGYVVLFDATNERTLEGAAEWLRAAEKQAREGVNISKILVANKKDLLPLDQDQWPIPLEVMKRVAVENRATLLLASATTSEGVDDVFSSIAISVYVEAATTLSLLANEFAEETSDLARPATPLPLPSWLSSSCAIL